MSRPHHDFVYLASQSPRRRQLLEQIGVRYELLLPDAHEDAEALEAVRPREAPLRYVERVTLAKLSAARARLARKGGVAAPILCSDTTVAVGARILGKPAGAAEAAAMLQRLSGREHRVITAVAVGAARRTECVVNVSRVSFAPLSKGQIERYVQSGEPMGKAGAYAIQSQAAAWIERITGSYSGIMGLPLYETAQLLQRFRVRY
ncbi:Maf family nucleotide pyrophosphatase [Schlegelella sp. S2-27]|uniref:dTTP/UTP pyrophosphatase n=1 Tax=Caldimonas mangrovi TaxID=2944811 RepID=A0ABT0YHG7_9BURK|nr:Maf family protein [Caldimonas mangrovi]MCM5678174.1 Maf family nucleotide pyrophosphatase [Caldimonas mangrovi]